MFNFVVEKSEDVVDLKNFKLNEEDAMEKTDRVIGKVFFVPCSMGGGGGLLHPRTLRPLNGPVRHPQVVKCLVVVVLSG